jgi:hypothetical protein
MAVSINTPYAILSFPHVFEKKARAEGGDPVYTASFIFSPAMQKTPAYKAMQDAVIAAAKEKFGNDVKLNTLVNPFKDAGEKEHLQGYVAGDMYINTWSNNKPGIVDTHRNEILLPEQVWAGQLVRANISPFAWVNTGRKGVSFGLNHIQLIKSDGPRLDGRASATTVFDDGVVIPEDGNGSDLFA